MAVVALLKSPVPVSEIDATGTADATTFLRGDGAWSTPSGGISASGCELTKSGTQSITASTLTAITFDGEVFDDATYHDNSTNPARMTVPATGLYSAWAVVRFEFASVQTARVEFRKNGSTAIGGIAQGYGQFIHLALARPVRLTAADYIEVMVTQFDSVSRNVGTTANGTAAGIERIR